MYETFDTDIFKINVLHILSDVEYGNFNKLILTTIIDCCIITIEKVCMFRQVKMQIIHDNESATKVTSNCNGTHIDTLASCARIYYCRKLDKEASLNHSDSGFCAGNRYAPFMILAWE